MSTHLKEKEEKIIHVLECLAEDTAKGIPVIVEGKNDVAALNALAIQGKIISAKTGAKTFLDITSEIEKTGVKEVILLLDFDRRGKEWTKRFMHHFERTEIKLNLTYWLELLSLVGGDVKDVEGLVSYMETLKRKITNS